MLFIKRIFLGFTLCRICSNLDFLSMSFKALFPPKILRAGLRKVTRSTVISMALDNKNCFQGSTDSQG